MSSSKTKLIESFGSININSNSNGNNSKKYYQNKKRLRKKNNKKNAKKVDIFNDLFDDLLRHIIIKLLDVKGLVSLASTNKKLRREIDERYLHNSRYHIIFIIIICY